MNSETSFHTFAKFEIERAFLSKQFFKRNVSIHRPLKRFIIRHKPLKRFIHIKKSLL